MQARISGMDRMREAQHRRLQRDQGGSVAGPGLRLDLGGDGGRGAARKAQVGDDDDVELTLHEACGTRLPAVGPDTGAI